ncbi:hypothetical protein ACLI1A_02975 [Flavobacterium sp. RHBU_3]|uniref:hypothetical protein n=1 Tax=Flavobacterium sp. RHBU_3 TaxID=3391184 RepID=UPI003985214A
MVLTLTAGKAAAQENKVTEPAEKAVNTTFNAVAQKNINNVLIAYFTDKEIAESKIEKRMRIRKKKKDPILIPYTLNKKSFSYC